MIKIYKKQPSHVPSSSRGFTLIETFVAVTILMITVLGPMSLLSSALQDSRYIKDQMTASFLAQEGVELMIYNRNIKGSVFKVNGQSSGPYTCNPFYWDKDNGFNCDTGIPTNFRRMVVIEANAPQYKITSTAYYLAGKVEKSVESSTVIFGY